MDELVGHVAQWAPLAALLLFFAGRWISAVVQRGKGSAGSSAQAQAEARGVSVQVGAQHAARDITGEHRCTREVERRLQAIDEQNSHGIDLQTRQQALLEKSLEQSMLMREILHEVLLLQRQNSRWLEKWLENQGD